MPRGKETQTMTKKAILKRANQICDMLNKLQGKAKELAMKIRNEYDEDDLEDLEEVLFDLYSFDLEDPIINASED